MIQISHATSGTILPSRAVLCCVAAVVLCSTFPAGAQETGKHKTGKHKMGKQSTLADLLLGETDLDQDTTSSAVPLADAPPVEVNQQQAAAHGVRRLAGKYVVIYTDLPSSTAVDQLPRVFDLAVPMWAEYFSVDAHRLDGWQLTGFVIGDKQKFRDLGLLPSNLPRFLSGYQRGTDFWVYDQPSDYYRRHLVLHEGVHGFMRKHLGGVGAPWYAEGIAELLATHLWEFGKLRIGYMPTSSDALPYWGRIKLIQDEFAASRGLMIREIMRLDTSDFLSNDAYAWAWGVAAFLDGHPAYRGKFRRLRDAVSLSGEQFTFTFENEVIGQLRELDEQWQLFVIHADYGYDFARNAVKYSAGRTLPTESGATFDLATSRGWQSTGLRLKAGQRYTLTASGQFVVRAGKRDWVSEANGVTLDFVDGRPLGMLLGSVRLDKAQPGVAKLGLPFAVSLKRTIQTADAGTLYLRVNDAVDGYADNKGTLTIQIEPTSNREQADN